MTPDKTILIERVRKLLAMTTANGASEAEMAAAIGLAQRLMLKYAISDGDVSLAGAVAKAIVWTGTRMFEEMDLLASFVAETFNVIGIVERRGREISVVYRGMEHDLAVAGHAWAYLRSAGGRLWAIRRRQYARQPKARYAWWSGLIMGLRQRAQRERKEALRETPEIGTALARTNAAVLKAVHTESPDIRPPKPLSEVDNLEAMVTGHEDSRRLAIRPAMTDQGSGEL